MPTDPFQDDRPGPSVTQIQLMRMADPMFSKPYELPRQHPGRISNAEYWARKLRKKTTANDRGAE